MEKTYQIITDATADLNAELMQESGLEFADNGLPLI